MIERLSGTFQSLKRVGSVDEFVNIVKECTLWPEDIMCRLHIYPYRSESKLIIIMYVDSDRIYLTGFDPVSSAFVKVNRETIKDLVSECDVEIYRLSRDAIIIDKDVIDHAAKIFGHDNLLDEFSFNELVMIVSIKERRSHSELRRGDVGVGSGKGIIESDLWEGRCEIVVRELIKSFGEYGFSETLSKKLSEPSTIAKILLYSEEYVITTKECKELTTYIESLLRERDYVAIKLQVGDYSVWLVKSGKESGVHDFVRGKPVSSGAEVIGNWEKVKDYLDGEASSRKRINVFVYSIKKDTLKTTDQ